MLDFVFFKVLCAPGNWATASICSQLSHEYILGQNGFCSIGSSTSVNGRSCVRRRRLEPELDNIKDKLVEVGYDIGGLAHISSDDRKSLRRRKGYCCEVTSSYTTTRLLFGTTHLPSISDVIIWQCIYINPPPYLTRIRNVVSIQTYKCPHNTYYQPICCWLYVQRHQRSHHVTECSRMCV